MTEKSPAPQASAEQAKEPGFRIQRIYLKDVSLEQPNAPQILLVASEPQVQVEIDISVAPLSEGIFEVALSSTVTAKVDTKVLFLVEAKQAGIFEFSNIPVEQIDPMLGIACPTILYPYLRSNIADIISRAGFQPIHLNEINFHAMYEHRLMQAQQEAAAKDSAAAESKPH
ncbi:protein-export chaperone SecB [Polynucleobacter sp. AP-Kaivos-20-H2]|jgi:preprotein translocase subunit SecB|uniref:protein-export chaperone SecB n=1 Tax=Polynucleobacter sp. AP-Kaivos-20-H2 TaxID=2689104 RepID=UPI001C0CE8FB|nr:protein-export chaperone SecB [Polynucleobacter sp. AP-Kaivos-20-H2]MBU3604639.1 protein-export chaperone SecB [Polynucleobacter sp. AP-Kaivos-20-H2]